MFMAKLAQTSVKYLIKARFEANGYVERPDVIGAIFGQTEGLLGPELDLRELQRTGRVGRIEVSVKFEKGRSVGEILIPTSLDSAETVLIASSLETIERIGPCNAQIRVESVEDLRTVKRKYVIERAKELLQQLLSQIPEPSQITEDLMQSVRANEIIEYRGLPAGPAILESDKIIVVEGRADVINLLKHGVRNVIGMDGTSVPQAIIELSREKEVTVLLDGDRGGDLILKELLERADVDYVARAPKGKEVEELTKKEIFKALRDAVPAEDVKHNFTEQKPSVKAREHELRPEPKPKPVEKKKVEKRFELNEEMRATLINEMDELIGTRAVSIFDGDMNFVGRVPIKELENALEQIDDVGVLVLDGYVDNELVKLARKKGVKIVVANENKTRGKQDVVIITRKELTGNE